jgi:hypothetical protein
MTAPDWTKFTATAVRVSASGNAFEKIANAGHILAVRRMPDKKLQSRGSATAFSRRVLDY